MPGRFAYSPNTGEPFLFQPTVRQPLGSEIGAHRQALRKESVDVFVRVSKATEDDVGNSMFARQPGVQAYGGKYIRLSGEWNKKSGDYVEPL